MKIRKIVDTIKKTTDKIMDASVPTWKDVKETIVKKNDNIFPIRLLTNKQAKEYDKDTVLDVGFDVISMMLIDMKYLMNAIIDIYAATSDRDRYIKSSIVINNYKGLTKDIARYDQFGILIKEVEFMRIHTIDGERIKLCELIDNLLDYIEDYEIGYTEEEPEELSDVYVFEDNNTLRLPDGSLMKLDNEDKKSE